MLQLDLFEPNQIELLLKELADIKRYTDNLRRGLFARFEELQKEIIKIKKDRAILSTSHEIKNVSNFQ